ncbi:putative nuclease HARBI1 [Myripristis murdjan]|uniref:putative nuclease HARBI1 n=1 Tax=Myripristis murdjan TaxID=586833 RepID=UPI001176045E|nr:putative nuclease HARBI1 [Myripristis murdjan]
MAYLALLEDLENRAIRRERVFKERADSESTEWLLSRYRLPKNILMDLCRDLQPMLERETKRTKAIPVHIQLLSTLGFLATGTFQREIGDICGISQPTLSRIMPAVLDAIISLAPTYIQFPYRHHQQAEIKRGFHAIAGFPNIIGAIDCTHVTIKAPSHNEYSYVNRKGFHSINAQIICDANMSLLNVVARWPGGTHDSFILQNSSVGVRLQAGAVEDGWLIGDRGYPLKPWLMTPVTYPRTPQEQHYNRAHARSRTIIERAIGLLKGRWLCLSSAGGALQYKPEKVCHIIMACCVLHNLAIRQGVPLQEPPRADEPMPIAEPVPPPNAAAIQTRERIIQRF